MAEGMEPEADLGVEIIIGHLLRTGVLISAAVVAAGGALYLLQNGGGQPAYQVFRGEPAALRSVSGVVGGAFSGDSRGIIQFGLLLLIATPVARVLFSVFAFWWEKDGLYVAITLVVLAVLLFSLFGV